jgi:MerR family regulatory protein
MNATMTPRRGLRVAEPAAAVGVSADTIRYYERTGLLLARARTPSGYRAYEASRKTRPDNCPVRVGGFYESMQHLSVVRAFAPRLRGYLSGLVWRLFLWRNGLPGCHSRGLCGGVR